MADDHFERETARSIEAVETPVSLLRRDSKVPEPIGPRCRVELAEDDGLTLPLGFPLDPSDASQLMRDEPTRTVALVGSPDCGKTTLLAVIFELFCNGKVGSWSFAGSNTLNALLRRCWYARTASGELHSDTPRTAYGASRPYVHFRVVGATMPTPVSLLFADLSGEYFQEVGSGADLDEAAPIVKGAQIVMHLLDGQHWTDRRDHERAKSLARGRIRRLVEKNAFGDDVQHVVALSRFDLCPPDSRAAMKICAEQLAQRWLGGASVVALTARPFDDGQPEGLADLLDLLLQVEAPHPSRRAEESARDVVPLVALASGEAQAGGLL